jgi:hypothetical protein
MRLPIVLAKCLHFGTHRTSLALTLVSEAFGVAKKLIISQNYLL